MIIALENLYKDRERPKYRLLDTDTGKVEGSTCATALNVSVNLRQHSFYTVEYLPLCNFVCSALALAYLDLGCGSVLYHKGYAYRLGMAVKGFDIDGNGFKFKVSDGLVYTIVGNTAEADKYATSFLIGDYNVSGVPCKLNDLLRGAIMGV